MATSGASVQGRGNDVLDRRDHFVDTSQNSESFHHPSQRKVCSRVTSKPFHSTVDNLEYGYFHVSCFDPLFLFSIFGKIGSYVASTQTVLGMHVKKIDESDSGKAIVFVSNVRETRSINIRAPLTEWRVSTSQSSLKISMSSV